MLFQYSCLSFTYFFTYLILFYLYFDHFILHFNYFFLCRIYMYFSFVIYPYFSDLLLTLFFFNIMYIFFKKILEKNALQTISWNCLFLNRRSFDDLSPVFLRISTSRFSYSFYRSPKTDWNKHRLEIPCYWNQ